MGRLGLEGLLLFVYSNLFSSISIYRLKGNREVFAEFFGFLFDNTSQCYFVFAFFFHTLLTFILLLIFDEYCLEQFYYLFPRIYSYSALILSQSKNNQAITFIWGSKQPLMFIHKSELSEGLSVEEKTTSVGREGGTGVRGKFLGVGVKK